MIVSKTKVMGFVRAKTALIDLANPCREYQLELAKRMGMTVLYIKYSIVMLCKHGSMEWESCLKLYILCWKGS